jgi:hypothetical protein
MRIAAASLLVLSLFSAIPAAAQPCEVNLAKYQAVQTGMAKWQVVSVLGCEGEELSRSDIAGFSTVVYMWRGASLGGNMNVTLQNGRVAVKAQFGLR